MEIKYPVLRNLLISVFSVEVGLSEELEMAFTECYLQNTEVRLALRDELIAFEASGESWRELLDNESWCVAPTDSEDEAREYIMEIFGARVLS
ncbi:hypothetical protein HNP46_004663 [Pseudomonas nitritireducens]|uniref:CdiI immunity protein domain-containing protein n=1 Tax=Pseudomonas nitroreducens TaxID=46680 RepID=A0A7W7P3Z2_PSENT|nr:hypothetical protein [Pseudomonas nitritireducens]MBB4865762.1 hypothetical protein [Pseudomonas nitritireducens]